MSDELRLSRVDRSERRFILCHQKDVYTSYTSTITRRRDSTPIPAGAVFQTEKSGTITAVVDIVLVGQLALMGKIIQLPEVPFYRRIDPGASTQRMNDAEKKQHWDPDDSGITAHTHWKVNRGRLRAVLETKLPLAEKLAAFMFVMKCAYWDRRNLVAELTE